MGLFVWGDGLHLTDMPNWIYQSVLLLRGLQSGQLPSGVALHHYPVPNMLHLLGLTALTLTVGWAWAGKVWIVGYCAFALWATRRLLHAAHGLREAKEQAPFLPLLLLLMPTVMFGLLFWYGNVSYSLSVFVCVLACAWRLEDRLTPRRLAWFLPLTFALQAIGFLFVALLTLVMLIGGSQRRRPLLLSLLPVSLLSGFALWGRWQAAHGSEPLTLGPATGAPAASSLFDIALLKVFTLIKLGGFLNLTHAAWGETPKGIVLCGLALSAALSSRLWKRLGLSAWSVLVRHRQDHPAPERDVWLTACLWSLFFVFFPQTWLGIADFGFRVVVIGFCVLLILTWPALAADPPAERRLLLGGGSVLCLWMLATIVVPDRLLSPPETERPLLLRVAQIDPRRDEELYLRLSRGDLSASFAPLGPLLPSSLLFAAPPSSP